MLSEKMEKALNGQVNAELYSSYLYLSMASYFGSINLSGFASWMKVQAMEEMYHVMKFYNFIEERGGRPKMDTIDAPPSDWESPLAVFEQVYAHEQKVTGLINELVNLAIDEKDHASNNFLQWFVAEQVEEEDSVNGALQNLKLVDDKGGLFILDRELGARAMKIPIDLKINLVAGA
jgi:ferritin